MIPPRAPPPSFGPGRFDARLAIVVPYRDRAEHLAILLPHLTSYFERDFIARAIPSEIHIVEQSAGAPFNRGAIKNAGFAIAHRNADYVCFHDVDYVPLWADYSAVDCPTSFVTWGVEGSDEPSNTPGCVLAMPVDDFVRVNGYSNDYAGWGYEDGDLMQRIRRAGLRWERRPGTFKSLPHAHHGLDDQGKPKAEAAMTAAIYARKLALGAAGFGAEGLSTLGFRVERTMNWQRNGVVQPQVFHHLVTLG